jgi:hypothetical protein
VTAPGRESPVERFLRLWPLVGFGERQAIRSAGPFRN